MFWQPLKNTTYFEKYSKVGSTPEAQEIWKLSTEKDARNLLGDVVSPGGTSAVSFSDSDALKYGYVDETAWETIQRSRFVKGKIPHVQHCGRYQKLRQHCPASTGEISCRKHRRTRGSSSLHEADAKLNDIDKDITVELTHIYNQRVIGPSFKPIVTHENAFWEWLWSEGAGNGTVFGAYRSWADPESDPIFKKGFEDTDLYK